MGNTLIDEPIPPTQSQPPTGDRATLDDRARVRRRVRRVRCNDLIDPEALRLGVDYGVVVEASVPVVVQFERVDTRQPALARSGGVAFPVAE